MKERRVARRRGHPSLSVRTGKFAFCHLKATDEAGHTKDPAAKRRAIEAVDRALADLGARFGDVVACVTGDHATPTSPEVIHSGDPVPFLLTGPGVRADGVYGAGYEVTGQPAPRVEERLVVGQAPGLIWLATESSEGHGVVVSRDGLVLTAAHVVEGEGPLRAAVAVGNRLEEREVEVLGGDRVADVALLRVSGGAPVAVPRLDPSLHQGRDELAAVGWFLEDDLPSAVRGTVAGLHAEVTVHDDPSLDGEGVEMEGLTAVRGEAPKGFSGGPAVGEDGAVRGLSVAATDGHTLVRPLHDALDVAEQVLSGEPTDIVTLGAP